MPGRGQPTDRDAGGECREFRDGDHVAANRAATASFGAGRDQHRARSQYRSGGGPGGQTSIFLRGTNSNHTKFLIDGIDVSDPATRIGRLISAVADRRHRAHRGFAGPQSGLYGADALGGVVSVITKKGEGPPKITYSMEGGTFNTLNENGSLSGGSTNYNYSFNVNHFHAGSVR